jgi:hypothetical protein
MTIEELTAEDNRLWAIVKETQAANEKASDAWLTVHQQLEHIKAKEKLRAELLAEMEAEEAGRKIDV